MIPVHSFRHFINFIFLCGLALSLTSCVAVNIGPGKPSKADGLKYNAPREPFTEIKNTSVDHAWKNHKTGNTIAFLSECKASDEVPLKNLESESLAGLDNKQVLSSEEFQYNEREAIRSSAQGSVDGVPVRMKLVIFKKNDCTFTLSFVGRASQFNWDDSEFSKFTDSFKVP